MDPKNVLPKPLRTPKGNSGQKNFKRMKSRLQLKVKVDESSKQKEHEVFEEEPLSSAAPQTEGNAIADVEVLHENENKEDPGKAKTLGKKTNQPGEQPSLTSIETELGPTYPADSVYLRKFIIYLTSSVFAPTTCTRVSPKCYPSVINTEAINRLNWCRFIIDTLIQTANAKDTKNWFKACMPYLMILYVDSLETDAIDVPQDGTRACVWTNKLIKLIVDMDTNSDGSFGKLPLKVCFRNNFSLFTSDSASVDMFIKCHVAGIQDEETLAKYGKPVIEMCTVFEDGLAKFLVSLSENNVKATFPEHNLEVNEQKEKPKRRGVRCRQELNVEVVNVKDEQISGMDIDEEKVKSEAAVHKTVAKKRKPNDDRMTGGRAGKKILAEPEIEVIQDSNTHNTVIKSMGEEQEMAVPNRQVHAMTPGLVTGSSISAAEVGELAQPSDQDGRGIKKLY